MAASDNGRADSNAISTSFSPAQGNAIPCEVDTASQGPVNELNDEATAFRSLISDLPPDIPTNLHTDELRYMPEGNKESGLQNCLKAVEKHDRDLCAAYREQIDTLLVFTGLFSAVVTAFSIESYQWLQVDPADSSVELLRGVVTLLAETMNKTVPLAPAAEPRITAAAIVRINSFWFLSLALSLCAALVAILCKQWLREYERDVGQSLEMALAVRHIRFQGLQYWKVGTIVTSVPVALQVALACFLIGVVDLLWHLQPIVASLVTVVSGITLTFYLATTFLPFIQYAYTCLRCCGGAERSLSYPSRRAFTHPQCSFKSAQAWIVLRIFQPIIEHVIKTYALRLTFHRPPFVYAQKLRPADSWVTFDINWVKRREHVHSGPRCIYETLAWIAGNLEEMQSSSWIWHCVWARWLRDKDDVDRSRAAALEIERVASAYHSLVQLDIGDHPPIAISQALVFRCSLRTDLSANTAVEILLRVAPVIGVQSLWTLKALQAVLFVYRDLSIRLSDDVAVGLFSLAAQYTNASIRDPSNSGMEAGFKGTSILLEISRLIYRGSVLSGRLLPGLCSLALQRLRECPPEPDDNVAKQMMALMISYYSTAGCDPDQLHTRPGVLLPARLAEAIADLWPRYVQHCYKYEEYPRRLYFRLLAISSGALQGSVRGTSPDEGESNASLAAAESQEGDGDLHEAGVNLSAVAVAVTRDRIVETDKNCAASQGNSPILSDSV